MNNYIKSIQNRTSTILLLSSIIMIGELIWKVKILNIGIGIIGFIFGLGAIFVSFINIQIAEDIGLDVGEYIKNEE